MHGGLQPLSLAQTLAHMIVSCEREHNSAIYDECQTHSAKVLALTSHESELIKTNQTIPNNPSFKLTSNYGGLRIILVFPNSQHTLTKGS